MGVVIVDAKAAAPSSSSGASSKKRGRSSSADHLLPPPDHFDDSPDGGVRVHRNFQAGGVCSTNDGRWGMLYGKGSDGLVHKVGNMPEGKMRWKTIAEPIYSEGGQVLSTHTIKV